MRNLELNQALVISQFAVEAAQSRHSNPPILRQGLSLRRQSVSNNKLVQFGAGLKNSDSNYVMRLYRQLTFLKKIRQKLTKTYSGKTYYSFS
jgi:hypothetical protein